MSARRHAEVVILGSGPAGYSAAVYAGRVNRKPLLITGFEVWGARSGRLILLKTKHYPSGDGWCCVERPALRPHLRH